MFIKLHKQLTFFTMIFLKFQPITTPHPVPRPNHVGCVQANGRLVQHTAHALQVVAELGGQADALRLAAGN